MEISLIFMKISPISIEIYKIFMEIPQFDGNLPDFIFG